MLLTINTDLSRSIIARYTNIVPGISTEAQLVFLNNAADNQPEQSGTQPVLRQTIQNIWHIHNCIEQNTILNIRLGLQFAGRFAGVASECAAVQLRGVKQTERLISMITKGNTVAVQHSEPQPLLKTDLSHSDIVLPVKSEELKATLPQPVWTNRYTAQLLTYLEQTVNTSGKKDASPTLQAAPAPAPADTKNQPATAEMNTIAAVAAPAHTYRVGVISPNMQLFYSVNNLNNPNSKASPVRQLIENALLPDSGSAYPQPGFTEAERATLALSAPENQTNLQQIAPSTANREPYTSSRPAQNPQQPQSTSLPLQPSVNTQPLVHAPGNPAADNTPVQQTASSPQRPPVSTAKPINTEHPRHTAQTEKTSELNRVHHIDSLNRPFPSASRALPELQVNPNSSASSERLADIREESPIVAQQPTVIRSPQAFQPIPLHHQTSDTASALQPEVSVKTGRLNAPIFRQNPIPQGVLRFSSAAKLSQAVTPAKAMQPIHPFASSPATLAIAPAERLMSQASLPETSASSEAPLLLQQPGSQPPAALHGSESAFVHAGFTPVQTVHRATPQPAHTRDEGDDSLDIPTVVRTAQTVQGETTTETATRNVSINAPQTIKNSAVQPANTEGPVLNIEGEINRLSDEIYRKLEQRFRSEKMRRGMW